MRKKSTFIITIVVTVSLIILTAAHIIANSAGGHLPIIEIIKKIHGN